MLTLGCSLVGLEPVFKAAVVELLTGSTYHWVIVFGYRSKAEQQVLYEKHLAGGPLAASPDKSAHCEGLAVDVQLIVNGQQDWNNNHPGWLWLVEAIAPTPDLHSGACFGDTDHIEAVNWREKRDWYKPLATPVG